MHILCKQYKRINQTDKVSKQKKEGRIKNKKHLQFFTKIGDFKESNP